MNQKSLTNRGIVYTNWDCSLDCKFCYYRFKPKFQRNLRDVKADLIKAKFYYKLEWIDISGGEPTIYRHIKEVLEYCKIIGLKVTMITNGINITKELDDLVDEWLISVHGTREVHNKCVGRDVFDAVMKNISMIKKPYRVNTVITKENYLNFSQHAQMIGELKHKPSRIHYIMFNPFHEFTSETEIPFLANPKEVGHHLRMAVAMLTKCSIETVVRYLPFCFAEGFENKVCGMSQVSWDFGEWDWCQQTNIDANIKSVDAYYSMSRNTAIGNSILLPECRKCSCEFICDGMQLNYLKRFDSLKPTAIKGDKIFNPLYFKDKGVAGSGVPPTHEFNSTDSASPSIRGERDGK